MVTIAPVSNILAQNNSNIAFKAQNKNEDKNITQSITHKAKTAVVGSALALATLVPTMPANAANSTSNSQAPTTEQVSYDIPEKFLQRKGLTLVQAKTGIAIIEKFFTKASGNRYAFNGIVGDPFLRPLLRFTDGFDYQFVNAIGSDGNIQLLAPYVVQRFPYNKVSDNMELKFETETNGDFTIFVKRDLPKSGHKTDILNFTKDGTLKKESYFPKQKTTTKNQQATDDSEKNALSSLVSDVNSVTFFNDYDSKMIAKFAKALSFETLEGVYKNDANILFFNAPNYTYRLNVRKLEDDPTTIIGIANKVNNKGNSEIYLVKGEIVTTNRSDKLIISKMKVVQNGLADNAPTEKKDLKVTTKTGTNKTSTSNDIGVNSRTPWLRNLFSTEHKNFYEGNISSTAMNEIDEMILESNPDGKTVKIVSLDKATGKVSVQGQ